ncbi:MAG: ferritin-like domain-containing protein, partial [Acidimicrobiales bacterium]
MTATDLPDAAEVDASIKLITDNAQSIFLWDYERSREQLVTLYNKAMSSQWSSVTDLDWSTDVDPEALVASSPQQNLTVQIARGAADLPGSPFATWAEKDFIQLGIESLKASLSQFMHGEQGAMIVAAKIVETVPWIDAKYYASTQTM